MKLWMVQMVRSPPLKRFKLRLGTPKLSLIMSALFVCLSIPILIFILLFNYHKNSEAIASTLEQSVKKTIQANIESAGNFIHPVGGMLRLLAGIATVDPAYFRTEASADLLYRALISAEQVDAVYVSFENGYHRVVTRMDEDRRRSDPKVPSNANWHLSYIDDFSIGKDRARHRLFFDIWGHSVGGYSVPSNLDIRTLVRSSGLLILIFCQWMSGKAQEVSVSDTLRSTRPAAVFIRLTAHQTWP